MIYVRLRVRADRTCVRFDRRVITYVNSEKRKLLYVLFFFSLFLSLLSMTTVVDKELKDVVIEFKFARYNFAGSPICAW